MELSWLDECPGPLDRKERIFTRPSHSYWEEQVDTKIDKIPAARVLQVF